MRSIQKDFIASVEKTLQFYSLDTTSIDTDLSPLFKTAQTLIDSYDIHPLFFRHPERSLFTLAISHKWNAKSNLHEKNALLNTFKLVATGLTPEQKYGTYSGYVKKLSIRNAPSGTMYDPQAYLNNTFGNYHQFLKQYLKDNYDERETARTQELIADWSPSSPLHYVRKTLRIAKEHERPFDVIVVSKTYQELMNGRVGYAALYTTTLGKPTLVLGKNYEKGMLEHEYAHSQSTGIWRWYQLLLFRGITEGLTESCTSTPTTYISQRKVLNLLIKKHPHLKKILYDSYKGDESTRQKLFSEIIKLYGLEGFLTLARVAPVDNPHMSGKVGASIFIKPQKAFEFFQ
jgi:hypothetical protein